MLINASGVGRDRRTGGVINFSFFSPKRHFLFLFLLIFFFLPDLYFPLSITMFLIYLISVYVNVCLVSLSVCLTPSSSIHILLTQARFHLPLAVITSFMFASLSHAPENAT